MHSHFIFKIVYLKEKAQTHFKVKQNNKLLSKIQVMQTKQLANIHQYLVEQERTSAVSTSIGLCK